VGPIREVNVHNSQFLDRCFAAGMLLGLLALFAAMAFALADGEPRGTRAPLILQVNR